MKKLIEYTLQEHIRALRAREYSSVELTRAYLDRIGEVDARINAFVLVDEKGALGAAEASDVRRKSGNARGVLDGIPYAVKDNLCVKDMRTTCASRILENYIAPYDATAVSRLRESGAVLLGKLNMDEFAMGSTGERSIFGATANPLRTDFVSGGSSCGSAAAVAALELPFSLGSDTGGSVRQPAAFCGVLGLKPTYGAISRYGLIGFAPSFDCVGLLTRNAKDAQIIFSELVGRDARDATSLEYPKERHSLRRPLRIAVPKELLESETVEQEVRLSVHRAMEAFAARGAEIELISLPSPRTALAAYCVLSAVEASSNLARYDGIRYGRRSADAEQLYSLYANSRGEGFGIEVKRRILFGTCMLTEARREIYLERAVHARNQIRERMKEIFASFDLILNPTTPTGAFQRGNDLTPAQHREADLCAVYANLAGNPALSVPFGKNFLGMPLGVQLTAALCREDLLLEAASILEEANHE